MEKPKIFKTGWVDIPIELLRKASWNNKPNDALKALRDNCRVGIVREIEGGNYELINGNYIYHYYVLRNWKAVHVFNVGFIHSDFAKMISMESDSEAFQNVNNYAKAIAKIEAKFEGMEVAEASTIERGNKVVIHDTSGDVEHFNTWVKK